MSKRVLVAPDKFKGSLTVLEVASAVARGLGDGVVVEILPLADGGDGTVAAAVHAGFAELPVRVHGATGAAIDASIAFDGRTAVVELASTCGLGTVSRPDPLGASTTGLGEAIAFALTLRPARIVVALGGSASTDGGAGMLVALGARLLDDSGSPVGPGGGGLARVARIENLPVLGVDLVCASDVTNPLTGPAGAAAVFGPQKGASADDIVLLDAALSRFASLASRGLPAVVDLAQAGAGAAGGTGFGCLLLGGSIVSGADYVLDLLGFDGRAGAADLVVTGEGQIDRQTAAGKLVSAVARRCGGTPVVAVTGRNLLDAGETSALGLDRVYALEAFTNEPTEHDPALSASVLEQIGTELAAQLAAPLP